MKFFDCQTAPSPRRVRMFIAEKGLEIPTVQVNLREREQLSDWFLAINPLATVPVLVTDDGTALTSTVGCRAYIEALNPEPPLLGRTALEKGRIADLVCTIESNGLAAMAETLRNSAKGMKDRAVTGPDDYAQIPELAERGRTRVLRFLPRLDQLIGDQAFIAGDALSAADIDAFVFVEFIQWVKLTVPDDCRNILRWHEAMRARASAAV